MELSSIVRNTDLNMLALCWYSTPAYYAFYYAGIFDAGLESSYKQITMLRIQLHYKSPCREYSYTKVRVQLNYKSC